ncbi:autotransporter secretion inner membrane protein TamB [Rhodovulum bhavnagarense]|uniref:Autotransporter secretion inner membrane protein TamB n=1 Tax=Rhodovulum bhavnagarense TaxID=992286 RepID=A0A4R2RTS8_9RHOB|nr:translocation/assembly module TamB domain-containing protein [Rhodovulum bhavnagarense]TCP63311.1 autotransporter secretion inner membrane protein TamB [Rhodovulum bhavnagarense]
MRAAFAFLLCMMCALPLWAQQAPVTDEGGRVLERFLEERLSGAGRSVTVSGFQGALSARATLDELSIADGDGIWITLSGVVLDWSRAALLRGRLEIAELSAERIELARLPESGPEGVKRSEAKPFALPDLPVSIEIGKIRTPRLVLGEALLGQGAVLDIEGTLGLAGGAGRMRLSATRSDAVASFFVDVSFSNETRELDLDLDLSEAQGGLVSGILGVPGAPAVELSVAGDGPLSDFAAKMTLATDGVARLSGTFALTAPPASSQARRFALSASGDVGALVAARLRPFFGDTASVNVEGTRLSGGDIDVDRLMLSTGALQIDGSLALGPSGMPRRVILDGRLAGPVALPLPGPETVLDGAGLRARFDAATGQDWSIALDLAGLARDGLLLKNARLSGTGRIAQDLLSGDLALAVSGIAHDDPALEKALGPSVTAKTRLAWQEGAAPRLDALSLSAGDVELTGNAMLGSLADGFPVEGAVHLSASDLSRFASVAGRGLGGTAEAALSGSYTVLGGVFDLAVSARSRDLVTGTPRLDPLLTGAGDLRLSALRDTAGTRLRGLRVATPGITLDVAGMLSSARAGLTVIARAPDLGPVAPGLDGPGAVDARIGWQEGGPVRLDHLAATAAGGSFNAQGTVTPDDPAMPVDLRVSLDIPRLAAFSALAGRRLDGQLEAEITAGGAMRGAGTAELGLRIKARDLALGLGMTDALWRGQSRMDLRVARRGGVAIIEELALDSAGLTARAVANGASGAASGSVDLTARLVNLAMLVPGLPGAVTLGGSMAPLGNGVRLDLGLEGPGGITARTHGTVSVDARRVALALYGRLPLSLANAVIAPRSLEGVAQFDLSIDGAPGLSGLRGRISTEDARLSVPDLSASVNGLGGEVTLAGGRARVALSGGLGGGRLGVGGTLDLRAPFPGDLTVTLNQAGLRDPLLYDTRLNGRVSVSGPLSGGATIGGRIDIGRSEVSVPSASPGGGGPVPVIAHRGASAAVEATRARAGLSGVGHAGRAGRPYPLDLVIAAPGQIFVRGRGLDAELGGRVHLRGTTADVAPEGRFELIRGRLDILSRRFDLSEGRIDLQGALDPYLYFEATSQNEDFIARVVLEGPANAPEIRFTSEPDLPEEEVLSRLLFGQGLQNLSALQAAELAGAVAQLAGGGGGGLLSQLRKGTGLDDLDIAGTQGGGTELRLGKYLSENVYSEVTVDDQGRSSITLNLDVTRDISLRGTLGAEGDTGIGMVFERDY